MIVRPVAPGPPDHGVVRHAALVAARAAEHGVGSAGPPDLVHAQFTDALWGPDIASAADAFTSWAAGAPRPLVVTLHDVPGADPDPARDARRTAGYARVVAACDAVVVSAEHEAAKVAALSGRAATVVGLPVPDPVPGGAEPAWADRPTLGVLGFVYPGKGHADVLDAAARHPSRPRVVAAGGASPGHGTLVAELRARAAADGVDLVVTGALSDADLTAAARAVTVPVVPGRTVSASGTLATWWACGRRPLAADGPYVREQATRRPGSVITYGRLDVTDALADPARTRLAAPPRCTAGAAHAALYRRVLAC
ncbi:hypothetical protein GCM10017691_10460 [Pseudonocardia petroleophila]|uniref:Uncharacterized protein n=1 Tax=Pseudonocardia petroleophila TaxID=37331 RepID=A0A7G7MJ20_9PSEU|nr:glycosyltransferase [Pseudonocardia petroleophila]QNG52781.1 hypothetical protein H6H00_01600 [Pseudonocardia petroleophila]